MGRQWANRNSRGIEQDDGFEQAGALVLGEVERSGQVAPAGENAKRDLWQRAATTSPLRGDAPGRV